jgi:hypothetical protein
LLSGGGVQVKRTLVDEVVWADSSLGEHAGATIMEIILQKMYKCITYLYVEKQRHYNNKLDKVL